MTRAWSRVESDEYRHLPLRAHTLLVEVPLHDVWRLELPNGGADRSIEDIRAILQRLPASTGLGPAVRALFWLRKSIGVAFRWDTERFEEYSSPYLNRLTAEDRGESLAAPGTIDGPFRVLYVRDNEALSEIRNATVHAFSALALRRTDAGHRLYWAIYVQPVGLISHLYMAAIDPFRRLLVYPAILRHIYESWSAAYAAEE
ncbi:MAG: DUF2867 domain-containing protein [Gemmatimonadota bacterium]